MANGTFSADGTAVVAEGGYNATKSLNTLYLVGTWGSGTITLEASPDNGATFASVQDLTYTANAVINLNFRWTALRLKLAGATNPSLKWWVL